MTLPLNLPDYLIDHPDGEIRFRGHRIGLYTVVRLAREGHTAEQIAAELPSLPAEWIRQALAFAAQNREAVDAYVEQFRQDLERQEAVPPGPGAVKVRALLARVQEEDARRGQDPDWQQLSLVDKIRRLQRQDARRAAAAPGFTP